MTNNLKVFGFGHASGQCWKTATEACASQIIPPIGSNLGFVYITDPLADELQNITQLLTEKTGVKNWVGTTGVGICATGREYFDEPAIAAMVGCFPKGSFSIFTDDDETIISSSSTDSAINFGVVHADPRNPEIMRLVPKLSEDASCFLVGGLSSSRSTYKQIAGTITDSALSGVIFSPDVPVATALTQGCSPIGPIREVTACQDNIAIEIDNRPALELLKEDIGEVLSRDLQRIGGYIFAAFPVTGSDNADYMVRNLVGLDEEQSLLAIGAQLEIGQKLMFCRRDRQTALDDLIKMVGKLQMRVKAPIKGAVYFSCLGRGPNMFNSESTELSIIQDQLGDIPLIGFFCNGEISHDRVYSYTGVLSLFL